MSVRHTTRIFILGLLFSFPLSLANANEQTQKAEISQTPKLKIVVENNMIEVTLTAPTEKFTGFSHFPKTDREKKIWEGVRKSWEDIESPLFTFSSTAPCQILESEMTIQIDIKEHVEAGQYNVPSHSEVLGTTQFYCENGTDKNFEVNLLNHFRKLGSVELEILTSSGDINSQIVKSPSQIIEWQ